MNLYASIFLCNSVINHLKVHNKLFVSLQINNSSGQVEHTNWRFSIRIYFQLFKLWTKQYFWKIVSICSKGVYLRCIPERLRVKRSVVLNVSVPFNCRCLWTRLNKLDWGAGELFSAVHVFTRSYCAALWCALGQRGSSMTRRHKPLTTQAIIVSCIK